MSATTPSRTFTRPARWGEAAARTLLDLIETGSAPDVDLETVARRTPGFTGADLANVLNEAALLTARTGGQTIGDHELDEAIDMVADRYLEARANKWQEVDDKGRRLRRTMGIASLGGATLDNEENYLMKKLYTASGAIQIENQARI